MNVTDAIWYKGKIAGSETAYIDGRGLSAGNLVTLMTVNLWSSLSKRRRSGIAVHGAEVDVLGSKFSRREGKYYYKVRQVNGGATGWLSEVLLNLTQEKAMGVEID
jgi:hypothetical protein